MTVKRSKRRYSFSTLIVYSEIRLENLISAYDAKFRLKMRDLDLLSDISSFNVRSQLTFTKSRLIMRDLDL